MPEKSSEDQSEVDQLNQCQEIAEFRYMNFRSWEIMILDFLNFSGNFSPFFNVNFDS